MSTTTNTNASGQRGGDQGLALRSTLGTVKQKAPRRLGSWAASILFVALVVIGLVALFQSQSDRTEVLAVTKAVPAGQVIERSDVHAIQVAGVPNAVKATDVDSVVGKRATVGLVSGQVLTPDAYSAQLVPGEGQRLVAVHLTSGRVPGGLGAGDFVNVLAVPAEGESGTSSQLQAPQELAAGAQVESVATTDEGDRVVTVLVDEGVADPVAAYSAAGQVTITQSPAQASKGEE